MTSRLGAKTWIEVAEQGPNVLVVPVGSCEQHGPHLPLDTDTRVAAAVVERVVARVNGAVVGPTIAVGASGEHRGFAGTLSIGSDALATMIVELVRSATETFAQVLFVNGHGGNADALHAAEAMCGREGRQLDVHHLVVAGGDAHAGRTETSLMLAIAPDVVQLDAAEAGNTEPLSCISDELRTVGVRAVSPNGVLGDPAGASVAEGERLLAELVEVAVSHVRSRSSIPESASVAGSPLPGGPS